MEEKKFRSTEKHVDESWKEQVVKEKGNVAGALPTSSISFSSFVTSLALQAFIHMGEVKAPGAEQVELDLKAAQETIDLLDLIREKTKGNLTQDEETLLNSLIADLQMKFVEHHKT